MHFTIFITAEIYVKTAVYTNVSSNM